MDPTSVLDFKKGGGTVTAVVQDDATNEVLMVAHMNEAAFRKTLDSGQAVYWSRSRGELWLKGEQSGHFQHVKGVFVDCDADAVLIRVEQVGGAACHTGKRSCFFRKVADGDLEDVGVQVFDPAKVYGR